MENKLKSRVIAIPPTSPLEFEWTQKPELESVHDSKIESLLEIKNDPLYSTTRTFVLPYTKLRSGFKYSSSLKIAEIDCIYKVCPRNPSVPYVPSLLGYSFPQRINTVDIGGGPGGFLEYIQFRYPQAMTIGMSERVNPQWIEGAWDRDAVDPTRLIRCVGQDFTGKVSSQWKSFLGQIQDQFPEGVDFISGNGYDDVLIEFYLLIRSLKEGYNGVLRMDGFSRIQMDVIYLATILFQEVYLFQPLVSGSDTQEYYLVMNVISDETDSVFVGLEKVLETREQGTNSFLKTELPEPFVLWITKFQDEMKTTMVETLEKIKNNLRIYSLVESDQINLPQKLADWALPDAYYF